MFKSWGTGQGFWFLVHFKLVSLLLFPCFSGILEEGKEKEVEKVEGSVERKGRIPAEKRLRLLQDPSGVGGKAFLFRYKDVLCQVFLHDLPEFSGHLPWVAQTVDVSVWTYGRSSHGAALGLRNRLSQGKVGGPR